MTGVSADQLRVWERRYGFPTPRRNAAGNRVYSDEQVERLTLIRRALSAGYRARDAILTPAEDLRRRLARPGAEPNQGPVSPVEETERVIALLKKDDLPGLRVELRRAAAERGHTDFVREFAGQLVRRVGEGWASGELQVRHEHLLSHALSSQLRVLLAPYEDTQVWPRIVLATFPNEQHGLGLDMVALFLAARGAKPRILGVDTPAEQIAEAALAFDAQAVGVSISLAADAAETRHHTGVLLASLPAATRVWIGGDHELEFVSDDPRVVRIRAWSQLEEELEGIRRP